MSSVFTYKDSGVDIEAGDTLVERIKPFAKKTMRPEVLAGIGGFGALFELKKYQQPVLVSGTDGVGTKLKLAFELNVHNTIGIDLVAMSVNDILVQGAEPLFFLDYFACSKLDVEVASSVIEGIAKGCSLSNCSLIGGETAEMPGMYQDGEYDLAGFAVGVVEKNEIIDGRKLSNSDVIIGVHSSGFHSNGYSLVRKIIKHTNLDLNSAYDDKLTWGEALLAPTLIYTSVIKKLISQISVHSMAHITGGGITGNLPRVIPSHLTANINLNAIPKSKLFNWMQDGASLNDEQMLETFNCGIGFIVIVSQSDVDNALALFEANDFKANIIGRMSNNSGLPIRYTSE